MLTFFSYFIHHVCKPTSGSSHILPAEPMPITVVNAYIFKQKLRHLQKYMIYIYAFLPMSFYRICMTDQINFILSHQVLFVFIKGLGVLNCLFLLRCLLCFTFSVFGSGVSRGPYKSLDPFFCCCSSFATNFETKMTVCARDRVEQQHLFFFYLVLHVLCYYNNLLMFI